jgi:DNA-binding transcriptional ArsR family regulator
MGSLRKSSKYDKVEFMFGDTQAIRAYFFKLGLSSEIADIYLALHAHGRQTISQLSRNSGVERTRLYRLIDELQDNNLVEIETEYKKRIIAAAPVSNLQILITKKEQDIHDLRAGLHDLQEKLSGSSLHSAATKIQAYRGSEGLKQMYWNQTRSKTENLSILYENMQIRTNLSFFERWAQTCNDQGFKFRSIICDNFLRTQQNWYQEHSNERLENWQSRYIPDGVFAITHSTVIYDDVTSYYNWKNGEIFGIEIHNKEIADAQRQFFEMLWMQGVVVDQTGQDS